MNSAAAGVCTGVNAGACTVDGGMARPFVDDEAVAAVAAVGVVVGGSGGATETADVGTIADVPVPDAGLEVATGGTTTPAPVVVVVVAAVGVAP